MVWAVISFTGERKLKIVKGKINSDSYIQTLKENLLEMEGLEDFIFMQDGAPVHRSIKTRKWLESENIETLPWVANSPDINLIENVWSWLKNELFLMREKDQDEDCTLLLGETAFLQVWSARCTSKNSITP
jgi:transposase